MYCAPTHGRGSDSIRATRVSKRPEYARVGRGAGTGAMYCAPTHGRGSDLVASRIGLARVGRGAGTGAMYCAPTHGRGSDLVAARIGLGCGVKMPVSVEQVLRPYRQPRPTLPSFFAVKAWCAWTSVAGLAVNEKTVDSGDKKEIGPLLMLWLWCRIVTSSRCNTSQDIGGRWCSAVTCRG